MFNCFVVVVVVFVVAFHVVVDTVLVGCDGAAVHGRGCGDVIASAAASAATVVIVAVAGGKKTVKQCFYSSDITHQSFEDKTICTYIT